MLLANGRAIIDLMLASLIVLACLIVILHIAVGILADQLARYAQGTSNT
jgi:putative hydroxymethylpyrimidine transport system permease protein